MGYLWRGPYHFRRFSKIGPIPPVPPSGSPGLKARSVSRRASVCASRHVLCVGRAPAARRAVAHQARRENGTILPAAPAFFGPRRLPRRRDGSFRAELVVDAHALFTSGKRGYSTNKRKPLNNPSSFQRDLSVSARHLIFSRAANSVIGLSQDHVGRPITVRFIPAIPMRRIDLRRQRMLPSNVSAAGAIGPHGFAAHAWAVVGHAGCAPGRGCDLAALDPVCLRLSCDQR